MADEEYRKERYSDFMIKLYKGAVIPKEAPNYNKNRVEIEIYSSKLDEIKESKIQIGGKDYTIKSQNLLNKIKDFVSKNLDILINWSIHQNNFNLSNNLYEGGMGRTIRIKYGQLTINVNGQVMDIGESCDKFINEIVLLIINEGDKTDEDYTTNAIINVEETTLSDEEKEFEKYCKLYEETFGKKVYIAEPSVTRKQTIEAIKICLKENKDMLDELLYLNTDKFIY